MSQPLTFPSRKSLTVEEIVEQNEDFYWQNIKFLEREYGGKLVTDKRLAQHLGGLVGAFYAARGKYPDVIREPKFPLEEFICVQLCFSVKMLGIEVKKWYFVRRRRIFVVR